MARSLLGGKEGEQSSKEACSRFPLDHQLPPSVQLSYDIGLGTFVFRRCLSRLPLVNVFHTTSMEGNSNTPSKDRTRNQQISSEKVQPDRYDLNPGSWEFELGVGSLCRVLVGGYVGEYAIDESCLVRREDGA